MIKKIVIVDTVGALDLVNDKFFENFPFVSEWHGHELKECADTIPHPHGGFACSQALLPLWETDDEIHVHFVRIFDSKAKSIPMAVARWSTDLIANIASESRSRTWVNCSWGTYIGSNIPSQSARADRWRTLIAARNATVMWAAGNSGDFKVDVDENLPSGMLTDCSHKIAAAYKNGDTARFSSDSTHAEPAATFWAVEVKGMNPVTGQWKSTTGTSFASPKATGLAAALDLGYEGFKVLAQSKSTTPAGFDGPLPHPKWGYGWLEYEYQNLIKDCPYTAPDVALNAVDEADPTGYFDFDEMPTEEIQKLVAP